MTAADREILEFVTGVEWETWLESNHATAPDAWLRIAKSRSTRPGLTIAEALDGALCFGWIDGQRRSYDDDSFLQRYSPRRRSSSWSQINVEKFEALAEAGRVRPAGYAEADAAKADGRWDVAYASQRTAEPPDDLTAALAENPTAAATFAAMSKTERYLAMLPLLKARPGPARVAALARVVAELTASKR